MDTDMLGLIAIIISIIFFALVGYAMYYSVKTDNACKNAIGEYDFRDYAITEPGYVQCCYYTYPDHIRKTKCEIVKVE